MRCAVAKGMKAKGMKVSGAVASGTAREDLGMEIFGTLIDMTIDCGVEEVGGKCGIRADMDGGGSRAENGSTILDRFIHIPTRMHMFRQR